MSEAQSGKPVVPCLVCADRKSGRTDRGNDCEACQSIIDGTMQEAVDIVERLCSQNLRANLPPELIKDLRCKTDVIPSLCVSASQELASLIQWVKAVPGFSEINHDTRITLIQNHWLQLVYLQMAFNSMDWAAVNKIQVAPSCVLNAMDARLSAAGQQLHSNVCHLAQRLSLLELSPSILVVFKALLLLSLGGVEVSETILKKHQENLNKILLTLLKQDGSRYTQLFFTLTLLGKIQVLSGKFWNEVKSLGRTEYMSELFIEMLQHS